ncbi:hypothetical protein QYE76_033426 [Lolium multiflorum]|uniref:Reverse transcriptase/retrotransposon-derived protein RNase H-like domain-containing protein n=1 Tax=Lolium multiflorum TaxID=4521 RepID=A0AAD8VMC4_LOLMU|nr:hypothetical protein QYE76_033426 [Lolium multiflorum]
MQQQQQLPPPPPLTGANALPVQPQPNRQQYQQVNRVEQNNDQPPPPAPLGRNVYEDPHLCMVVFVTEPMDRQSVHRRSMEVNAVMPAVPKYMLCVHGINPYGLSQDEDAGTSWTTNCGGKLQSLNETASAGSNLAESLVIAEEKKRMQTAVALAQSSKLSLAAMSGSLGTTFKPTNETKDIVLDPSLPSAPFVSVPASPSIGKRSSAFLRENRNIFAWSTDDLVGVPRELAEHSLNVRKDAKPADAAFKELKNMLVTAPILASPLEREPMLLYIAATNRVVSVVVVVEREEEGKTVQRPVYYLSEVLSSSKQNYPHFQKMTYGVFMAATKLKHYFEEHPMKVVSEAPISDIMGNKDASGGLQNGQFSYHRMYRCMKEEMPSQALADFLVDMEIQYKPQHKIEYRKMHFDGSKLKEGSRKRGRGYLIQARFVQARNSSGIALAHLRVPSIKPSPESESIFVPESHVVPMEIDEGNPGTVPANSGTAPVNSGTATPMPEEAMLVDSMDIDMPVFVVREAPSWVEPIKEFLINGTLPVDENESRRIQRRSKAYTIINGEVYKRSVTGVLQRCVEPEEGREMLEEIHRGECGHHASSRALVAKVFRHGFYWPTALDNAEDLEWKKGKADRSGDETKRPWNIALLRPFYS